MSLPGGPANKLGNRYEQLWTVLQVLRVIRGEAVTIEIERPGLNFAEFVVRADSVEEHHQAKMSHAKGKWTLASLEAHFLQAAIRALAASSTASFVFVSASDAPDLRELSDRARSASDFEDFESRFVATQNQKIAFHRIIRICPDQCARTAWTILRRITVRAIDEKGLREQAEDRLRLALSGSHQIAEDRLRSLVADSVSTTLDRAKVLAYLSVVGIREREASSDPVSRVDAATDRYLRTAERRLIQNHYIPTPAATDLLERIRSAATGLSIRLTGTAGSGKTASLYECVRTLRSGPEPMSVLAFRLDRLDPTDSATSLGRSLGLEESPALVLAAAAKATSEPAVLVIDQLDAVSTASGRRSEFFDAVEDMLLEIRALRPGLRVHVILACRKFDWDNDHRLRRLVPRESASVTATEFSDDQLKTALEAAGFAASDFSEIQLTLLRLPFHLALLINAVQPPNAPSFSSTIELLDLYWSAKRTAVNQRATPSPDHWHAVVTQACTTMSDRQELSIPREHFDRLPSGYVKEMFSEGVLVLDQHRAAFWHEAFFDYCFARNLVGSGASLVSFLTDTEQHLFRRAQLRQVLEYLRDPDRPRYCRELKELLEDNRIRWHLKDLAVSLAMSKDRPSRSEWNLFRGWIEAKFSRNRGLPAHKLADLVGRHHFMSESWFATTVESGVIADRLASTDETDVEAALHYLRVHVRHSGSLVAQLLKPYVGTTGAWPERLCSFIAHADLAESRDIFELFLALTAKGILDPLIDQTDPNSMFWLRLGLLSDRRPAQVPEALAAWLQRILARTAGGPPLDRWLGWPGGSASAVKTILTAADQNPAAFVKELLAPSLDLAESHRPPGDPPRRDPLWGEITGPDDIYTVRDALREGLARAIEKAVAAEPECAGGLVPQIAPHTTSLGNYLLLKAFKGGGAATADAAANELALRPWRFQCGPPANPYWTSRELVSQISPLCSAANRAVLETAILSYVPDFERTPKGARRAGWACFTLLGGIPPELRTHLAKRRYQELDRKFGQLDPPSNSIQGGLVVSPIPDAAVAKMTDQHWHRAMKQYGANGVHDFSDPTKGGATELARELERVAADEPDRFAKLILRAPAETDSAYFSAVLRSVRSAQVTMDTELLLALCQRAYAHYSDSLGMEVADALGSHPHELPERGQEILSQLATEHPDPPSVYPGHYPVRSEDADRSWNLETAGLNCVRGRAVLAIHERIRRRPLKAATFRKAIEHAVRDPSSAVRSQAALLPCLLAAHDGNWAFQLFQALLDQRESEEDDMLLATRYVRHFVGWDIRTNLSRQRSNVERALESKYSDMSAAGAAWAAVAGLFHEAAADLMQKAYECGVKARQRIAEVANDGLRHAEHRRWCEVQLTRLFNDPSRDVRGVAAQCWRNLRTQSLEGHKDLITSFCQSQSFPDEAEWLLTALDESVHRVPELTCTVLERLMERSNRETWDWQFAGHVDEQLVTKLLLRTYHQHRDGPLASRCLDLLDRMCLSGLSQVVDALNGYER